MADKRDLVLNQAEELLLNMLKNHIDNEFCNYVYLELTLGGGIGESSAYCVKKEMLRVDGAFKVKKRKLKNRNSEQYSMEDLMECLIHYLGVTLRTEALADRAEEIIKKYGTTTYFDGIDYYLKETLLGIKAKCFDKHYNDFEEMIEEYILRA